MTREEIDSFFEIMVREEYGSSIQFINDELLKKTMLSYKNIIVAIEENLEQFVENIISQIPNEHREYFEFRCVDLKAEDVFIQDEDKRNAAKVRYEEYIQHIIDTYSDEEKKQVLDEIHKGRVKIIQSFSTDLLKLEMLEKLDNDREKAEVATTFSRDNNKITVIGTLKDFSSKAKIAETLESDEEKFKFLKDVATLEEFHYYAESMASVAKSIKNDAIKFNALSLFMDHDLADLAGDIAITLVSDEFKFQAMQLLKAHQFEVRRIARTLSNIEEYLADKDEQTKVDIICSLENDDKKIQLLRSTQGLSARSKAYIICSLKDDDKKIGLLQTIGELSSYQKGLIICSLKDDSKKIKQLQIATDLSAEEKASIICSLKDDTKKIILLNTTEDLSLESKTKIIYSLQDDDKKIELVQSIEDLPAELKARIICSLKNDDKKIGYVRKCQDIQGLSLILSTVSPEKVKELLDNGELAPQVWHEYREKFANVDFVIENLRMFITLEEPNTVNVDEVLAIVNKLYQTNSDVAKNINFRFANNKILSLLGEERVNVICCYPDVQDKLLQLEGKKLDVFSLCIDSYIKHSQTEDWTPFAQDILEHIGSGEYDELINSIQFPMDEEDIKLLTILIQNSNWCDITSMTDAYCYESIIANKCVQVFSRQNALPSDMREAVIRKLFGHDLQYAMSITQRFGKSINHIKDEKLKAYVKILELLTHSYDETAFKQIIENCEFMPIDKNNIERKLKNEYCALYNEGLYVPDSSTHQGNNIYEAGTDFKIIMTTIGAYKSNFPDNYAEDWNRPSLWSQHFCTCYIRNDMLGCTDRFGSLYYGFSKMESDSLVLSGPKDISSHNGDGLASSSTEKTIFLSPDEQIDNTDEYNEMDFRRIQAGTRKQPDYIILFRENGKIPDLNMKVALKAQKQWGGLPIVIIDKDKCLDFEREKVNALITRYEQEHSNKLARQILQKVRNNRQTRDSFCSDIEEYLTQLRQRIESEKEDREVDLAELEENYKTITSSERVDEARRIINVFKKIKNALVGEREPK